MSFKKIADTSFNFDKTLELSYFFKFKATKCSYHVLNI